jgi:hypothetical protein
VRKHEPTAITVARELRAGYVTSASVVVWRCIFSTSELQGDLGDSAGSLQIHASTASVATSVLAWSRTIEASMRLRSSTTRNLRVNCVQRQLRCG